MTDFLQGPEIPSLSGKTKQLMVFMHGLGSNGDDLISLAPFIQPMFPDAYFVSPNACERYDMAPFGYQWFSLKDRSVEVLYSELERARGIVDSYLLSLLAKHKLTPKNLVLIGFSQGTMTALHTALRWEEEIAAIIGFSGRLIAPEKLSHTIKSRPPVCLIHGNKDEVVDISSMHDAAENLRANNVATEEHTIDGLMHSIDSTGLRLAVNFLKQNL